MIQVAIFGVGLIGGSLALCFKDKPDIRVVGHSPNPDSVAKYMKHGVVDYATTSLEEAALGSDFLFLCVPVGKLEEYMERLRVLDLKPGCIITDVGSTKGSVAACAERLQFNNCHFIGGHPMAGSERSGVEAANSYLFENAFYVLSPAAGVPQEAMDRLTDLLKYTRAQLVQVEPDLHDTIVGAISHLPHIIAVALVNQIDGYNQSNELYQRLAAGGFRDITRIASSDPYIWRDILINNKQVLLKLLKDWSQGVSDFVEMIEQEDGDRIIERFRSAHAFRSSLPERRKGVIVSLYEFYVDVPDQPGVIARITTLLSEQDISLSNLHIIENRANEPGVLRLSFRTELEMERAQQCLQAAGYSIHK